jgi:hypothetical protein
MHHGKVIMHNDTELIRLIKSAFEQGYQLGYSDRKDGIYVNLEESTNLFIKQIFEYEVNSL